MSLNHTQSRGQGWPTSLAHELSAQARVRGWGTYAELHEGQNTSTKLGIYGLPVPYVPGRVLGGGP